MKALILIFSVFVSLLLVGCGGSGGGGNGGDVEQFQGSYSGTWTATNSHVGTSSIVVQPNGSFTGTFVNTTLSLTGTIEGQITGDGSFEGTISVGGGDFDGEGEFTLSEDMLDMAGEFTYQTTTYTFDFSRENV